MFTIMRDNKHEERFDLDSLELAGDEMLTVDGGLQADLLKNGAEVVATVVMERCAGWIAVTSNSQEQ